jgi:hypothetical protein
VTGETILFHNPDTSFAASGPSVSVQQYTSQFIKEGLRLKLAKQLGKTESQQVRKK